MAFLSSMGSAHPLLTPTALWVALCVWSCVEVAFYFVLHYIIHPRLEPPREAPQGPLAPRESLARLVDALERLKGVRLWRIRLLAMRGRLNGVGKLTGLIPRLL